MTYKTEQEAFWSGEFGNEYPNRNQGEEKVISNVVLWGKILNSAPQVKSIMELGCNIGLNLQALNRINKDFELHAYEINANAASKAQALNIADITCDTILNAIQAEKTFDLTFTNGVLIHIDPDYLDNVYRNLYNLSHRYIMVCEYYNPSPVMVKYRGYDDRMFKRDFAGDLIDKFNLRLVDYGFVYHRDNYFPKDDLTWFLLEK